MLFTVLVTDFSQNIEDAIVFGMNGRSPFITSRREVAEVYMEQLKEQFPEASYRVAEVRKI